MRPNTIVNVRGTSGAGKTTLITDVVKSYPNRQSIMTAGRKQPLYYILSGREGQPPLALLGHYESACGGVDTISKYIPNLVINHPTTLAAIPVNEGLVDGNSYDTTFGLVKALHGVGYDVLFEGLLISGDVARTKKLHDEGLPVNVVVIDIPLQECLDSVIARRAAKGNDKEFNPKNTAEKHRLLGSCVGKLLAAGVPVLKKPTRELAVLAVKVLLGF